ncbi:hypothetical protein T440DRAFT_548556 [Plenodomus tracheiphilus IPT5]|uniref:Uncharacterized protein n=1 Tax=Plenodomus tracheiphilus IPT5 TaxID=1408161 RepID=A0A6A7BEX0_9PLEO|nr:hypothetical protein T440DRAFT_548556 [Plenodomus tracheiphilus IPT5]
MCKELHIRFYPCLHTNLSTWTYCAIIPYFERNPTTGHACRRYKLRYQNRACQAMRSGARGQEHCFECTRVRIEREYAEEWRREVEGLLGREGCLASLQRRESLEGKGGRLMGGLGVRGRGAWYWVMGVFGR